MNLSSLKYLTCICVLVTCAYSQNRKDKKTNNKKKNNLDWKQSSMAVGNKKLVEAYVGDTKTLDCSASGNPQPSVKWFRNGTELNRNANVQIEKFILTLKDVTLEMAGNYSCNVTQKKQVLSWTVEVTVKAKAWPLIVEGPHNITQFAGSNVSFQCKVLNDPKPSIKWQKVKRDDEDKKDVEDILVNSPNLEVLTFTNIQRADEGRYRCVIGNVWGMKTVDAYLKVLEPVVIPTMPPRSNSDKSISMNEDFFSNRNDHSYSEADDEFDSDQFFETTKGPKKNRNKDKKGHNKDKKGHKKDKKTDKKEKDKMRIFEEEEERYLATTFATTSNTITIWSFNDDLNAGDELMTSPTSDEDSSKMASTIPPKAGHASVHKGTISSWTIYTIVGAVGGVILLIGLIAITLTVCCQREEGGIYKSTPV
ncbi:myosin light chain kinase, smooth muscle-like [Biomphalaria glabrata]|uniref:receptor protein-tyrosine kinase n=2 Tax=Biomphalaria glabrata TaxID=6526 RepID=A0A9W2ZET8_BIOGL|nr:myosin light chain kinase, smooth muscle-like [Biomphalaria glabrata]XP_055873416.1 myosin light chain kinase, smooth muscle-like [Biomphalaria glabrata]XP_055873426.1 myosin light chain kinase, smooth muscle-like [Biomphalaria glabrata]XP_055873433.1 myosin light chain kinase, smooth muscle-like [Biomphalaria glabrata]XP_055873442.1 myosin light chain kinase, smooth muscle-like [Biomphalaria glabrata]